VLLSKQTEQLTTKVQSWLADFEQNSGTVNFEEKLGQNVVESIIVDVKEPCSVTALLSPADLADSSLDDAPNKPGSLHIACATPAACDAPSKELDLEAWVRGGSKDWRSPPLRASVRTARALWLESRAVVYASDELHREALDALVRFTVAERETAKLEQAMHALWPSISGDAELTHAVARCDLKRQDHVNAMTVLVARMKSSSIRIRLALEQFDPTLSEPSKRLFAELALAADLHHRLECLAEPIQFATDHYELANTRLIDQRFAAKETDNFVFEIVLQQVIVLILVAEIVAIIYGIRLIR
jgi:hypothetical protein